MDIFYFQNADNFLFYSIPGYTNLPFRNYSLNINNFNAEILIVLREINV